MSSERPTPQECVDHLQRASDNVADVSLGAEDRRQLTLVQESARLIREAYLDNPKPDTDRRDRRERMMAAMAHCEMHLTDESFALADLLAERAEELLDASDAIDAEASHE